MISRRTGEHVDQSGYVSTRATKHGGAAIRANTCSRGGRVSSASS